MGSQNITFSLFILRHTSSLSYNSNKPPPRGSYKISTKIIFRGYIYIFHAFVKPHISLFSIFCSLKAAIYLLYPATLLRNQNIKNLIYLLKNLQRIKDYY